MIHFLINVILQPFSIRNKGNLRLSLSLIGFFRILLHPPQPQGKREGLFDWTNRFFPYLIFVLRTWNYSVHTIKGLRLIFFKLWLQTNKVSHHSSVNYSHLNWPIDHWELANYLNYFKKYFIINSTFPLVLPLFLEHNQNGSTKIFQRWNWIVNAG